MKKPRGNSFDGVSLLRILRFAFILLIVGLLVSAYYLYSEGKLLQVLHSALMEKAFPFVMTYWYEIGVSIILFSLGFWCGRMSVWDR